MNINPFEDYEAYKVNAELMKFASSLIDKVKKVDGDLTTLLKDLAIDCTHITEEMLNNNIIKCWIGINIFGYTQSIYITKNNKWKFCHIPEENDNFIWITCIEFQPNCGHGCKWIEIKPEDIIKELNKHHIKEREND